VELLSGKEKELCAALRLLPKHYLFIKVRREGGEEGGREGGTNASQFLSFLFATVSLFPFLSLPPSLPPSYRIASSKKAKLPASSSLPPTPAAAAAAAAAATARAGRRAGRREGRRGRRSSGGRR
jgi:hypothetical protein